MKEEETRLTDRDIYMKEELEHLYEGRRNNMQKKQDEEADTSV